jgi:hypothetical protein
MSTYMKVPGIGGGVGAQGYEGWIELGSVTGCEPRRIRYGQSKAYGVYCSL